MSGTYAVEAAGIIIRGTAPLPVGAPVPRWELPTLGVALTLYGGFALLTWFWYALPLWLSASVGALLLAWHSSLQHETIHHHPTPLKRLNALLGAPPLALWLPYAIYRRTHLAHHAHGGAALTDPDGDPESHYLPAGTLAGRGAIRRRLRQWNATLAGRLMIGPLFLVVGCWRMELQRLPADRRSRWLWIRHGLSVALVLGWVGGVCRIPLSEYLCLMVYPSISLGLLRSFAEHRAHPISGHRTAVVEAGMFWSGLFLNNNLHAVHHRQPGLPWYRLPAVWRAIEAEIELGPEMRIRGGYAEIFRKHLFSGTGSVEHPGFDPAAA
ncbi:MAG: fatty acid desaturase [Aliidongia sp.]